MIWIHISTSQLYWLTITWNAYIDPKVFDILKGEPTVLLSHLYQPNAKRKKVSFLLVLSASCLASTYHQSKGIYH